MLIPGKECNTLLILTPIFYLLTPTFLFMAQLNALGRQILETLQTRLIPWANTGSPFILLDAPPRQIGSNPITESPGKKLPLQHGNGQQVRTQVWPAENLNAMTTPYLGCVVEGEADIVIGTTTAMCRKLNIPGKRWIISAPQQSFLLTPPQVPVSKGKPHWERPHPENAYSRILWMQFHTSGVRCHFCTSEKGEHRTHPLYFIYGAKFLPLAESLVEEMSVQSPQYLPLVYHQLSTMLHQMVRSLVTKQNKIIEVEESAISVAHTFGSTDALIQKATDFIDQHLYDYPLSVEQIAAHLHLSSRHLARIFQREVNTSVMQLVTKRRMELACQLLIESQMNVVSVAGHCGYASVSSFIKAFKLHSGISPTAYRSIYRINVPAEQ